MTAPARVDALDYAADIIARNGYCHDYLWDTDQAAAGTPREACRVDILGALGIALHGDPRQVTSQEVRELEALLAAGAGEPDRVVLPPLHRAAGGRPAPAAVRCRGKTRRGAGMTVLLLASLQLSVPLCIEQLRHLDGE